MKAGYKEAMPGLPGRQWQAGAIALLPILFFWLVTCPVFGQAKPKQPVTEKDYHKWGSMYFDKISDDGRWLSYRMDYDQGPDTLVVKSTDGKQTFKYAGASNGTFCGRWFAALQGSRLETVDLLAGVKRQVLGVEAFAFSKDGTLITLEESAQGKMLCIAKSSGGIIEKIPGVKSFTMNKAGEAMIYSTGTNVVYLSFKNPEDKRVMETQDKEIGHMAWQPGGKAFAFLTKGQQTTVHFYSTTNKKHYSYSPPHPIEINSILKVSSDGKVFFSVKDDTGENPYAPDAIQVWNGNDKWTYPQKKRVNGWAGWDRTAVWFPKENRFLQITNKERPLLCLSGSMDYALSWNPEGIGPQYRLTPKVSYYLTNLKTGETKLWLEGQSNEISELGISPGGRYAAYFRDGQWQVYDFKLATHRGIETTGQAKLSEDQSGGQYALGIAGWGNGDKSILLYDEFDLWEIDLASQKAQRLTKGKEQGVTYRLSRTLEETNHRTNFDWRTDAVVDTSSEMLFKATTDTTTAYCIRNKGKLTTIDSGAVLLTELVKAPKADVYTYRAETFSMPPEYRIFTKGKKAGKKETKLASSNPHHEQYLWGRAETISYKDSLGTPLKGVLHYPAGYDPQRKYPMVVYIYEQMLYRLHRYTNPSIYSEEGFNVANFTANGYFVLLPDITYRAKDSGASATDCVLAAVDAVIAKGFVNPGKIGLIGHSFGGYETNFIITQTNRFAAAISGAGIADLQSYYLSNGLFSGIPEICRVENQQWRMGQSFFDDMQGYDRNSPVRHAKNVATPLLLWTGNNDGQVHHFQSIAYYLALRRLDKEQMLVIYPKEQHGLMQQKNQKDLTIRVRQWFDYYLKNEPPADWIKQGIK